MRKDEDDDIREIEKHLTFINLLKELMNKNDAVTALSILKACQNAYHDQRPD